MNRTLFSIASVAVLACGCVTPMGETSLTLSTERPLDDKSTLAADLASKHYQRLVVVPPAAHTEKAEGELESLGRLAIQINKNKSKDVPPPPPEWPAPAAAAADLERGLMKQGIELTSADVAGRAAASAEHASKAERLLALGKATGADAILEVVAFEWRHQVHGRWFLYDMDKNVFDEVDEAHYTASEKGHRWRYYGSQLEVAARLLDAQTGSVEAEFKIACNVLWNLPTPYKEDLAVYEHELKYVRQSYSLGAVSDLGRETCLDRATQRIAAALTGAAPKP